MLEMVHALAPKPPFPYRHLTVSIWIHRYIDGMEVVLLGITTTSMNGTTSVISRLLPL